MLSFPDKKFFKKKLKNCLLTASAGLAFKEFFYKQYKLKLKDIVDEQELLSIIKSYVTIDISLIIMFAQSDPLIRSYCYHPKLNTFWNELILNKELIDILKLDFNIPPLLPQVNFHSLNLIIGLYYFNHGYDAKNDKTKDLYPLLLAEKHGSIHAVFYLTKLDFIKLLDPSKKNDPQQELVKNITERAYRAALLHGAPGYIHLARIYYRLVDYYKERLLNNEIRAAYLAGLKYLHVAQSLEAYCKDAINNAYFSTDIADTNNINIYSLKEGISKWLVISHNYLNESDIEQARSDAHNESTNFINNSNPLSTNSHKNIL